MKKTLNLLLLTLILLPSYAFASEQSFVDAMWDQGVSNIKTDGGLLIVFGDHDFAKLCTLAKEHGADVQLVVSSTVTDDAKPYTALRCNAS